MSVILNLSDRKGLHHYFLRQVRDIHLQQNRALFRQNLRMLGMLCAQGLEEFLDYAETEVETPLGTAKQLQVQDRVVLATVMRAGLPFFNGMLEAMPFAETAFVGAYRSEESVAGVSIEAGYKASPKLEGKTLILADPMLATGSSLVKAFEMLCEQGKPNKLIVASVVAAPEGIEHIVQSLDREVELFVLTAALDKGLNEHHYIVPGLGDAGDLAYGPKH